MKRMLLAVAAAVALIAAPMFNSSADAQYRYRSYRPYSGGYNNYYGGSYYSSPYYGNSYYGGGGYYGNGYYGNRYSTGRGYGGYGGGYSQPGVYIGGSGIGVGFGF